MDFDRLPILIDLEASAPRNVDDNSMGQLDLDWPKVDANAGLMRNAESKFKFSHIKMKEKGYTKSFLILQVTFHLYLLFLSFLL